MVGHRRQDDLHFDRIDPAVFDLRATIEHELRAQTTTMIFALVGVVLTMAGLAFALARFT